GATYYFLLDGQGSVLDLVDSSGTVYDKYTYDPYGNITSGNTTIAREMVANPFRYLGAVLDASTGLYHLGARYYDPRLGRFTQPDPSNTGAPGDYTYGGDAPSSLSDPSGLSEGVWTDGGGHPCPKGWRCYSSQMLENDDIVLHAFAFLMTYESGLLALTVVAVVVWFGTATAATLVAIYIQHVHDECAPLGAMFRLTREHGFQMECW
ncbi:MAG: RHS repeat-associated core domain-containing protein, partial [Chloroflexota bacterium]